MEKLGYKTKIWMIILILLMQIILPTLSVILESEFSLFSIADEETR